MVRDLRDDSALPNDDTESSTHLTYYTEVARE